MKNNKYDKKYNYYEVLGEKKILKQKKGLGNPVLILENKIWREMERKEWVNLRLSFMTPAKAVKMLKNA